MFQRDARSLAIWMSPRRTGKFAERRRLAVTEVCHRKVGHRESLRRLARRLAASTRVFSSSMLAHRAMLPFACLRLGDGDKNPRPVAVRGVAMVTRLDVRVCFSVVSEHSHDFPCDVRDVARGPRMRVTNLPVDSRSIAPVASPKQTVRGSGRRPLRM